jgi:hypothetical protein
MPAGEETANPSAARERALVHRVVRELAGDDAVIDGANLAGDPPQAATLVAALREHQPAAVIACAGVLERIPDFVDVVEALVALSAESGATVVLTVPNHAFGIDGEAQPASAWGEGAVEELRRLLPGDHVVLHQVALRGAALVPEGARARLDITVDMDAPSAAPVGFVIAFGPRAARLAPTADAGPADLGAERAHERARTAELDVLRAAAPLADPRPSLPAPNGAQPAGTAG